MRIGIALVTMAILATGTAYAKGAPNPDRLLAGRVAGKPVPCISQTRIIDTQTFDDGSIYYRMAGSADYLNRPHECAALKADRAYATRTPSTSLCAGDILEIFDSASRIPYGSCSFDSFVPYAKVHKP